jgi:hypothetical protein
MASCLSVCLPPSILSLAPSCLHPHGSSAGRCSLPPTEKGWNILLLPCLLHASDPPPLLVTHKRGSVRPKLLLRPNIPPKISPSNGLASTQEFLRCKSARSSTSPSLSLCLCVCSHACALHTQSGTGWDEAPHPIAPPPSYTHLPNCLSPSRSGDYYPMPVKPPLDACESPLS